MTYTRDQALNRIRQLLITKRREGETTCQTAARLGIFCRGYDQWNDEQLREQYPWLAERVPADTPREEGEIRAGYDWWALKPIVRPEPPKIGAASDSKWIRSPIDAFIAQRLQQAGLSLSPRASKRILIRRLSLDLTGLPPTPEEIAAFEADSIRDPESAIRDRFSFLTVSRSTRISTSCVL